MNRQESIIYAAGIFDGEGCVLVTKPRQSRATPGLNVQIAGNYVPMFEWLVANFGGSFGKAGRPKRIGETANYGPVKTNQKQSYQWLATGAAAQSFLELVLPYLMEKKEQAYVAVNPDCQWLTRPFYRLATEVVDSRMAVQSQLRELRRID